MFKSSTRKEYSNTDSDDDATTSSSTVSKTKKKKYDESYISVGFVDSNVSPLCMLCSKPLPNSSMAPAKLCRDLEPVHPESKDKNKEFFVRKKEQLLESQKNMMRVTQTINEKATEALYLVSYRISKAEHLSTVPLSNDTVSRRIHDLASYVKQELVTRLQKTRFALQMDESTDVAGLAILLVICEDYGSKHKTLLLHKEVRWLSRGKTLTRLFELRAELQMFLSADTSFNLKDRLYDKTLLFRLSFMADIFQKLNELNEFIIARNVIRHKYGVIVENAKKPPLDDFWCRIRDKYPMLGKMALNILLPFPTTYLCETGFSTYAATKTKYRNRLDVEPDMRLTVLYQT
ncbi:Zinc finger BED domain-containing protein 5 [Eumeta japonica]|uniref:Zinc finger BED domain-containing protein 5 n=1 Tax=Eumeta variegata TaxID=151549 RepID=A0A4C1T8E7_EUMVA|nr:Zinc finger BED domain-containing protein 5 [Eumeta japonica]